MIDDKDYIDNGGIKVICKYKNYNSCMVDKNKSIFYQNDNTPYNCIGVSCGNRGILNVAKVDWVYYLVNKQHLIEVKDDE